MKKKGFTLIELLAVIVILAVIALIAVPVIMNIISSAKKSAFKDTAYGIIKSGELYYAVKELDIDGMDEDVTFTFPNNIGDLEISGALPQSGSMTITKDGDIELSISNGQYCITKGLNDRDLTVSEDLTNCGGPSESELATVYFNPVTNSICTDYVLANSTTGVTDGCLKWYKYKTEGTKEYLILDHNTTSTSAWIDFNNEMDAMFAELIYYLQGEYVPTTLHNQLGVDTTNWTVEPGIITLDEILEMIPWYETLTDEEKADWYTLYQEELDATMTKIEEKVGASLGEDATDEEYIEAMFEEVGKTDISMPTYMYEDIMTRYLSGEEGSSMGYWTSSMNLLDETTGETAIWAVYMYMLYGVPDPTISDALGLRPTIILENGKGLERKITDIITINDILGEEGAVEIKTGDSEMVAGVLPLYNSSLATYTSSNPNVATVDENGIVTGVSAGDATITITDGTTTKTVDVTVIQLATDIEVNTTTVSMIQGATYQLETSVLPDTVSQELTYSSSNSSVVVVDENGLLTGKETGTATITISTTDGSNISKTVEVTVRQQLATDIELSTTTVSMLNGATYQIGTTVLPADTTNKVLTYTSSDTSITTVDSNGLITAVAPGTATITISTTDGSNISKTVEVTVRQQVETLTLSETTVLVGLNSNKTVTATVLPDNAHNKTLNWVSADQSIATVDENGMITGVGVGTTTITVSAIDGSNISKTINVTVSNTAYTETVLNGADPVLRTGMIPVVISADGTVTKADTRVDWYNYTDKEWANAVLVTNDTRDTYESMEAGESISESDILAYFVWIPRYKYKLWYVEAEDNDYANIDTSKVHSIDIVFENKTTTKSDGKCNGTYDEPTNGCYLTHPAFTFGEEVNGIWVGKFETGYSGATSDTAAQVKAVDSSKVIIKPTTTNTNVYSWRYNTISNMFHTALGMNSNQTLFGLTSDSDTHMMKNTEWGAVTYLAFSDYGKDSEVYYNNNSNFLTGCGANDEYGTDSTSCLNMYGTKSNNVYNQSTTGNISGIFDMSGGAYEYVMGYTTGARTQYGSSGFTASTFPADKYVDIYTATRSEQYSNRILGDATGEMGPFGWGFSDIVGSWYYDYAHFVYSDAPWFYRSGFYETDDGGTGLAYFWGSVGDGLSGTESFRIVLI